MTFEALSREQWQAICVADAVPLAELPFGIAAAPQKTGVEFLQYHEDGMGEYLVAALKYRDWCFLLDGPLENDDVNAVIHVAGNEPQPGELLKAVCQALDCELAALPWISDYCTGPGFAVYRVDDNGNEIIMQRFFTEQSAQRYADDYQSRGHKQIYLVKFSG